MRTAILIDGVGDRRIWCEELSRGGVLWLYQTGRPFTVTVWRNGIAEERDEIKPKPDIKSIFHGCFSRLWFFLKVMKFHPDLLVIDRTYGVFGVLLKWLGFTRRFAAFMSDYEPKATFINLCCRFACRFADEVWVVSERIPFKGRRTRLAVSGITPAERLSGSRKGILYISSGSIHHGLDILMEISCKHSIPVHIVGNIDCASPTDAAFMRRLKETAPQLVTFHGYQPASALPAIAANCFAGWAVYTNLGKEHFQHYGFPAKYLDYIALGLPVLTTDAAEFSKEIEFLQIGKCVAPTEAAISVGLARLKTFDRSGIIDRFTEEWNRQIRDEFQNIK